MPELRKMPVTQARAVLARLHLNIDVRTSRASASPGSVIAQSPQSTAYVALGDTVIVCSPLPSVVDTAVATVTSVPTNPAFPALPVVRMPSLIDSSYATATRMLGRALRFGRLNPTVKLASVNGQKVDSARSIVANQRPAPGTILTPLSPVLIVLRDTTTIVASIPPPRDTTTPVVQPPAPNRETTTVAVVQPQQPRDTSALAIPPRRPRDTTAIIRPRRPSDTTTVSTRRTTPPTRAGTPVVARPKTPRDTVRVVPTPPPTRRIVARIPLWIWMAIAAGVLLAGAALLKYRHWWKDRAQLAAVQVVPRLDAGRPRVVFTVHDDETADEAFARIGVAVRAVADFGSPQLRFPRPQRKWGETSHV